MELIGIAINKKGEKYFIAKNSYGPKQGVQGYVYLSYDYIAMKTIAIGFSKR
jgi:bleomycin hydrolase